jgi:hypothetical protein
MPRKKTAPGILVDVDWSRGMIRDLPRSAMPQGSVYDSEDFLLDRTGLIRKRGGTSYYGPDTGVASLRSVAAVELPSGSLPTLVDSSSSAHTVTANGAAATSSAQAKFGGYSLHLDSSANTYVQLDGSSDFGFSNNSFTVDFWLYAPGIPPSLRILYDSRPSGTNGAYLTIYLNSDGTIRVLTNSADVITSSAITAATWHHIELARSGANSTKLFIDGVQSGSTWTGSVSFINPANRPLIGASGFDVGTSLLNGYIDELRVSNIARHTAGFTPETAEYASDANTKLLLHFDQSTASSSTLVAAGSDNHLYSVPSSGSATDEGSVGAVRSLPLCKPVTVFGDLPYLIITADDGTSSPYVFDGTTLEALDGSPPAGRQAGVFKQRPLLANSEANSSRLWFGPLVIGNAWDVDNSYLDLDLPVTGLAPIRNAELIFSASRIDYLTGSIPPGVTGFDMAVSKLAEIGCTDARSLASWQNQVIFANGNGVYMTNGAAVRSITEPQEYGGQGIGDYWRSLLDTYDESWQIHGGLLGDYYLVTIRDENDTLVATLMCYLPRRAWWRLSNIDAGFYATSQHTGPFELYYADRSSGQVVALSGILTPTAANKNDADGTAVEAALEGRLLGSGSTLKSYGFARITYDMRDAASDNPSLAVSFSKDVEGTTFTAVPESPLAEVADSTRKRVTVNRDAQGISLRFVQTGASSKTEVRAIELEERLYDPVIDGN